MVGIRTLYFLANFLMSPKPKACASETNVKLDTVVIPTGIMKEMPIEIAAAEKTGIILRIIVLPL